MKYSSRVARHFPSWMLVAAALLGVGCSSGSGSAEHRRQLFRS